MHETHALAELDALAPRLLDDGEPVILAGGDGAYMAGLSALARAAKGAELPPVALAPGGTVSTVARAFGMRGSLVRHARRVVTSVTSGKAKERTIATLRVREEDARERVGFIFGTGLVVRFFDLYDAGGDAGYLAAARIVSRVFVGSIAGGDTAERVLAPLPMKLSVEGAVEAPEAYSLVVASVIADLGLHMRVTYRAGEDPARLHLVASPLGPRALGPQLPLVLAGRRLRGRENVDRLVTRFRVDFTGARRAYVLDGDVFEAPAVEVAPGPRVRLLTPR